MQTPSSLPSRVRDKVKTDNCHGVRNAMSGEASDSVLPYENSSLENMLARIKNHGEWLLTAPCPVPMHIEVTST